MADTGYTQIPNCILDSMAKMHRATLAIILSVARKTAGFADGNGGRKEWDTISLTQFEQMTDLSRQGVIEAIEDAVKNGWLERRKVGLQRYEYRITSQESRPVELVNSVDQSSQLTRTSQLSRPELVNSVDTQKKERKIKKNISSDEHGEPVTTEQQQYFGAVCTLVGWDYKTITKDQTGQVAQTVGVLQKAGYCLDDLRHFWVYWKNEDWRGKQGQKPTIAQVRSEIGKIRITTTLEPHVNGNGSPVSTFNGSER